MASTKIINVLKDDSFSEILDIFKSTPANEVIFVLPKRSKAFQKDEHFERLRVEANDLDKSVSFLCSNPELNDLAKKYKFDVLLSRQTAPVVKKTSSKRAPQEVMPEGKINMVNEIEEFYERPTLKNQVAEPEDEEVAEEEIEVPVVARRMDDIIQPSTREERNVRVASVKEKAADVQVHPDLEKRALEEISGVWKQTPVTRANFIQEMGKEPKVTNFAPTKLKINKLGSKQPTYKRLVATLGTAVLVIAGVVVYVTVGSAQVNIKPQSQALDGTTLTVSSSDTFTSVDAVNFKIPGQLFTIQKTVSNSFPATGSVDVAQKARGTITVHNDTPASQQLIATTRFTSADGHLFRTLAPVVVPAGKTADVQIIADTAGPDFNVPAGKFNVPAFQEKGDTVKYNEIYGVSMDPMHGGTSGKANVVSQNDYDQAITTLTAQLRASIKDDLSSQTNGLTVIASDSAISIDKPTSTAGVGDAADSFTLNLSGSLKTVGFSQSDLNSLINQYVEAKKNLTIVPDKLTYDYSNVTFTPTNNVMTFTVDIKGPGFSQIDENQVTAGLLGKNDSAIKAYLGGLAGISTANVTLSPFWVRSVPKDEKKVHITISY